ncbi:MAG TPA: hypothetical protein VGL91_19610 [Acidobacteriota bacterium]|jgi:hypothetical protein
MSTHNAKIRKLKEYREERPRVTERQIQRILDELAFKRGDRDPDTGPGKNSSRRRSRKVVDFQEVKKRFGGADRIRTDA